MNTIPQTPPHLINSSRLGVITYLVTIITSTLLGFIVSGVISYLMPNNSKALALVQMMTPYNYAINSPIKSKPDKPTSPSSFMV